MMRASPKSSFCLMLSCVALLLVFSNSVWTQDVKKNSPGVKELQQQRLAVLEEIRDGAKKLFQNARTSYEDVQTAERELLAARLAYADTQKDRIKACDEAIENAIQWQERTKAQKAVARGTAVDELKAKALLLEFQIARENAEANE